MTASNFDVKPRGAQSIWSNDTLSIHMGLTPQLLYFINDHEPHWFDFKLSLPDYTPEPYKYTHLVRMSNRTDMNVFNMYISYDLAEQLETKIIKLFPILKRHAPNERPTLGQLSTPGSGYSDIKLQMIVKDEYFYWTIQTILKHLGKLKSGIVENFKFYFLLGELKFNSYSNSFPTIPKPGEIVETYMFENEIYKRELLHTPIIVIYLKPGIEKHPDFKLHFKELVVFLQSLFPPTVEISTGVVPRFNCRIDDNLFFSVDGNNDAKFDKVDGVPPEEYKMMVSNPEKYEKYNDFSRYISGHDVLDGNRVNNIRSYHNLFKTPTSFRDVYESVGLSYVYNSMWGKLGLAPILERQSEGGKRTKRIRRTRNKNRKKSRKYLKFKNV